VDAVAAYWRQQAFAGRAVPPVVRQTAAEVTAFVAANPLAIGYVPAGAALPASVKALPLKTAERGTVYEVEDVEPPTLLTSPPLRYPPLLRRDGVEGHVVLEFVVLADGRVAHDDIQVVEASDRRFGEAAISVIRGTRFRPARREGDAVAVRVRQRVQFSLAR
jgi:protein TonB